MHPPQKKLKRRVPDTHRQRVSVSCDRCKVRKIRCIRISGENDPCAACAQLSLDCESTLPRKQRVYASYDQLQLRYRALDTLIKRLYPGENVESVDDICELARKQGIDLSGFEDEGEDLDPLPKPSDREARVQLLLPKKVTTCPTRCKTYAYQKEGSSQHLEADTTTWVRQARTSLQIRYDT